MARLPRFFLPGVPLHVIHRGNNRSAVFAEDGDRSLMCAYMAYASRTHDVSIHAYVLMTNHVHLLLTCMRYIELNPVRAGMVSSPAEHRWSSFAVNALGAVDPLVRPHALYRALGARGEARLAAYRTLFAHAIPAAELSSIRDATQNAWALGSNAFCGRVEALARRAERLPRGGARPRRVQSRLTPLKVNRD